MNWEEIYFLVLADHLSNIRKTNIISHFQNGRHYLHDRTHGLQWRVTSIEYGVDSDHVNITLDHPWHYEFQTLIYNQETGRIQQM
jgi:hypothetical protein